GTRPALARQRVNGAMITRLGSARLPMCRGENNVGIDITIVKDTDCWRRAERCKRRQPDRPAGAIVDWSAIRLVSAFMSASKLPLRPRRIAEAARAGARRSAPAKA